MQYFTASDAKSSFLEITKLLFVFVLSLFNNSNFHSFISISHQWCFELTFIFENNFYRCHASPDRCSRIFKCDSLWCLITCNIMHKGLFGLSLRFFTCIVSESCKKSIFRTLLYNSCFVCHSSNQFALFSFCFCLKNDIENLAFAVVHSFYAWVNCCFRTTLESKHELYKF